MAATSVRFVPGKRQKYIVAKLHKDEMEITVLWGNPNVEWHKNIAEEITASGYTVVEVLGGGWLCLDPETQAFYVWGKSDNYGPASQELVREILTRELPGVPLKFDQEP